MTSTPERRVAAERLRLPNQARHAAVTRLLEKFPEEYAEILKEERLKRGLSEVSPAYHKTGRRKTDVLRDQLRAAGIEPAV